jgi:hypothetical protein
MKKTFIVSTGRTGTQFLAHFFSENCDKVKSVHEPYPSRRFRILSNMYREGKVDKKKIISAFNYSRKDILVENNNYDYYIESNNFLYGFSGVFNEIMKDAKIIHIVRDPRDYIKSHLNHGVFKGKKLLAKKFLPYWFMNVKKGLKLEKQLNNYEILAGRWVIVNKFIEESCKGNDNYKMFKYEDIFGENRNQHLFELAEFIGLPAEQIIFKDEYKKLNEGKKNIANKWNTWSKEELDSVHGICGDLMTHYNYEF